MASGANPAGVNCPLPSTQPVHEPQLETGWLTAARHAAGELSQQRASVDEAVKRRLWDDIDEPDNPANPLEPISWPQHYLDDAVYHLFFKLEHKPRPERTMEKALKKYPKLPDLVKHSYVAEHRVPVSKLRAHLIPTWAPPTKDYIYRLDIVHFQVCYRKLLRAQLECDLQRCDLTEKFVIIGMVDKMAQDQDLFRGLRCVRRLCTKLGVQNTLDPTPVPFTVFTDLRWWQTLIDEVYDIFEFGPVEQRLRAPQPETKEEEELYEYNLTVLFAFLTVLCARWSGTAVVVPSKFCPQATFRLQPARFVQHMLPHCRPVLQVTPQ